MYLPFDLADNSIEGHFSEKALERTLEYAKKIGVDRVVSHGGFIDRTVSEFDQGQEIVARRLNRLNSPDIQIVLENNPLWSTQMWINEPVLVDAKGLKNVLSRIEVDVGVCVDVEHLYRAAILSSFYHKYSAEFDQLRTEEDYDELVDLIDSQFNSFVKEAPKKLDGIIRKYVEDFFTTIKPYMRQLHVCGFDYRSDRTHDGDAVLPAGHLPLNYKGPSGSLPDVEDKIDHNHYLSLLKGLDVDLVIEFNNRPEYNFRRELMTSIEYLRGKLQ